MNKAFFAVLACLAASTVHADSVSGLRPTATAKQVEFGSITKENLVYVRDILAKDGLIAVTNVPHLAEARQNALVAAAECILDHGPQVAPRTVGLLDRSQRSSWAAFVGPHDEKDEVAETPQCPRLQEKMEFLRTVVDVATKYFVQVLDKAVKHPVFNNGLMRKMDGGSYQSFQDIVDNARHLDHFHVYQKAAHNDEQKLTLDRHTDQGLFIAVVPSIRVSETGLVSKVEDSFKIELFDGRVANLVLPSNGDVVLFMIGDGANYLTQYSHSGLHAVPHALDLTVTADKTARSWFGRMFFAPNDAMLNDNGDSFKTIIDSVVNARRLSNDFPTLGCSASEKRLLVDSTGKNCTSGEAYCWMSCMPMSGLNCTAEESICFSSATNSSWVDCPSCHDMTATLICPSDLTATLSPTSSAFSGTQLSFTTMVAVLMSMAMFAF